MQIKTKWGPEQLEKSQWAAVCLICAYKWNGGHIRTCARTDVQHSGLGNMQHHVVSKHTKYGDTKIGRDMPEV